MLRIKPLQIPSNMLFLLLFFTTSPSSVIHAQQSPFKNISKFDTAIDLRTNVCPQQQFLFKDVVELPRALQGLNLTVVTTNYPVPNENAFFTLVDNKIKEEDPGLFAVILDELSRRAGFSWRNSFVAVDPLDPAVDKNKTWGDLLEWEVKTFDLSMDYWARSVGRMAKGIAFPESFYDASIILVEHVDPNAQIKQSVDLWSFLNPFENLVWLAIGLSILFTGLTYWLLERLNGDSDERHIENKPLASIFLSAIMFTGHFEFRPNSNAARIMTFSWSFWAIIVSSAYTANLASFLVTRHTPGFRLSGIKHAESIGASICVQKASNQDEYLSREYPNLVMRRYTSEEDVFTALIKGQCLAAASQLSAFEVYERTESINGDCTLKWDGRFVYIIPSGMATAIDTGTLCTSLITYVIDVHMAEMKVDGFLDEAWKNHLSKIGNHECAADVNEDSDDTSQLALSLTDMGGIFILHAFCSFFAVCLAFFQFFYWKGHTTKEMKRRLAMKRAKKLLSQRGARHNLFASQHCVGTRLADELVIETTMVPMSDGNDHHDNVNHENRQLISNKARRHHSPGSRPHTFMETLGGSFEKLMEPSDCSIWDDEDSTTQISPNDEVEQDSRDTLNSYKFVKQYYR